MAGLMSQLPLDRLKEEAQGLGQALGERGLSQASSTVESLTGRLTDIADGKGVLPRAAKGVAEGENPVVAGGKAVAGKVKEKVGGALGGLSGGSGNKLKVTNIVESIDVPVSREVAYQQWTQFEDFPSFMKKVESVKQEDDNVVNWQAQIFWSHRQWKATIVDQVPNERIVWKSEAEKGRVDGSVTFHELSPDLTRILLTLEYHPKGFFEHTANLWRAQGRRVRVELKHFRRHVATHTMINEDELDGWPGEIHDAEVTDEDASDEDSQEDSREESREESAEEAPRKRPSKKGSARRGTREKAPEKSAARKRPRKSSTRKSSARRSGDEKSSARTAAARRSSGPARTSASAAKKASAKKAGTKKSSPTKTSAKKSSPTKASAKRAGTKKSSPTKAAAKKASPTKTAAKKSSGPAKKSTARKAPARKSTPRKSAARKASTSSSGRRASSRSRS